MNNLPFVIIILVMLACNCPNMDELAKKDTPPANIEIKPTNSGDTTETKSGGKVNSENFKKLKNGMKYKEAVEILGGEGNLLSESEVAGYKTEVYQWKNGMTAGISLVFQNDKLLSKSQYGLD